MGSLKVNDTTQYQSTSKAVVSEELINALPRQMREGQSIGKSFTVSAQNYGHFVFTQQTGKIEAGQWVQNYSKPAVYYYSLESFTRKVLPHLTSFSGETFAKYKEAHKGLEFDLIYDFMSKNANQLYHLSLRIVTILHNPLDFSVEDRTSVFDLERNATTIVKSENSNDTVLQAIQAQNEASKAQGAQNLQVMTMLADALKPKESPVVEKEPAKKRVSKPKASKPESGSVLVIENEIPLK